ncbi:MAG: hypothetical protein WB985_11005 [Candidatus Acidiferrales bacterium]
MLTSVWDSLPRRLSSYEDIRSTGTTRRRTDQYPRGRNSARTPDPRHTRFWYAATTGFVAKPRTLRCARIGIHRRPVGQFRSNQRSLVTAPASTKTKASCENLASPKLPDTTIESAWLIPTGRDYKLDKHIPPLPEFCEVNGQILNMPWGPVAFLVWLPTGTWNHEKIVMGTGTLDGPFDFPRMSRNLNDGYAVAGTHVTYDMHASYEVGLRIAKFVRAFYPHPPKPSASN